jgi:hypothetical protein
MKSYFTFAIIVFAASHASAQEEPARAEKAYLRCLLAHSHEPPGAEGKSVVMMIHKCNHEFNAYLDECEATGAANCFAAAEAIAWFAFRSTRK